MAPGTGRQRHLLQVIIYSIPENYLTYPKGEPKFQKMQNFISGLDILLP